MRPRSGFPSLVSYLCLAVTLAGCNDAEDAVKAGGKAVRDASSEAVDASKKAASDLADEASAKASQMGEEAVDASKKAASDLADKAVDASKDAASDLADATKDGAKALYDDLRNDGELSQTAKGWLQAQAEGTSIETFVVKGVQLTPVALEASKVLYDAVDSETAVEPIFQEITDDPTKVDAAIGDMPRVEVVEDVTVGFKQLEGLEGAEHVEERGFLVMWRHEDHLVGFVYRSRRTIDLAAVVAETPRLIRMTQKALDD